ncbi:MAG: DUF4290 domain-containing protein [Balneolaceae bacterium]
MKKSCIFASMFLKQNKPKDYDCGYNLDLMIEALPGVEDISERIDYAKRVVGLIKQSHPNWVDDQGKSKLAWDYFFELAEYDPGDYGIENPYETGHIDDAR